MNPRARMRARLLACLWGVAGVAWQEAASAEEKGSFYLGVVPQGFFSVRFGLGHGTRLDGGPSGRQRDVILGIPMGYSVQRFRWGSTHREYQSENNPYFGLWPEIGYTWASHGKDVQFVMLGVGPVIGLEAIWLRYSPRFVFGHEERATRFGFGHGLSISLRGTIGVEVSEMYLGGDLWSRDRAVQFLIDPAMILAAIPGSSVGGRPLFLGGRQAQASLMTDRAWA